MTNQAATAAKCFFENIPIGDNIIREVKNVCVYNILGDENSDILGKEQLYIGIRFFDKEKMVRLEFLDFVILIAMYAKSLDSAIDNFVENTSLDIEKCVGQGHKGCFTEQKRTVVFRKVYEKNIQ